MRRSACSRRCCCSSVASPNRRAAGAGGAGGEYASAISFVYEHSPLRRRARNVAVLLATTFVGIMVGSVLARVCAAVLSESAYESYGWRILFLLGLPLAAAGMYLRSRVEETPEVEEIAAERREARREASPLKDALRSQGVRSSSSSPARRATRSSRRRSPRTSRRSSSIRTA